MLEVITSIIGGWLVFFGNQVEDHKISSNHHEIISEDIIRNHRIQLFLNEPTSLPQVNSCLLFGNYPSQHVVYSCLNCLLLMTGMKPTGQLASLRSLLAKVSFVGNRAERSMADSGAIIQKELINKLILRFDTSWSQKWIWKLGTKLQRLEIPNHSNHDVFIHIPSIYLRAVFPTS